MKRTIYLHGHLRELYPEPIEVEAETVAEAVRALQTIPELEPSSGQPHPVQIDGIDSQVALFSQGGMEEIHVRPQMGGAGGRGGFLQILLGVVLIAVSFAFPAISLFGGMITSSSIFMAGAMMVAGGVLQLLMPVPEDSEQQNSKYLGATKNTTQIGTPVPVIYGTAKVGGHYLSFDVDAATDFTGEDEPSGTSVDLGLTRSKYRVYDRPSPAPKLAVVNPRYRYETASAGNVPTSGWIR